MKKHYTFIIIIGLLISCQKNKNTHPPYAIISGQIEAINPNIALTLSSETTSENKAIKLNQGAFKDTIYGITNKYVLYDGKTPIYLYLEPGYNSQINYSYNQANIINFSGDGAEINKYLNEKSKQEVAVIGNFINIYKLNETEFLGTLDSIKVALTKFMNKFPELPKDFKAKELRNIEYGNLKMKTQFESSHKTLTNDKDFKASTKFDNLLKDFNFNNIADFNYSKAYNDIVTNYYRNEARLEMQKSNTLGYDMANINVLKNIIDQDIKNQLLFEFTKPYIEYSSNVDVLYKSFIENSTDLNNNKVITDIYTTLIALSPGKPSPTFSNYTNINGSTNSLLDFKGKYVFIDVWATWCGPCLKEIPYLKSLIDTNKNKNVVFISISIDNINDKEKWENMVKSEKLGGIQLFADNATESKFIKDFQISGIPRFIFIDPDGNIINSNTPRPSNPNINKLFEVVK